MKYVHIENLGFKIQFKLWKQTKQKNKRSFMTKNKEVFKIVHHSFKELLKKSSFLIKIIILKTCWSSSFYTEQKGDMLIFQYNFSLKLFVLKKNW